MEASFAGPTSTTCGICQKVLSSKQNLKQHMNIHTGEKPYKCTHPECDCSYRHASQLSNHRLTHQQPDVQQKMRFDDIKAFASLLIKALRPRFIKNHRIPEGPYTKADCLLPPISKPQKRIKLPSFDSLAN